MGKYSITVLNNGDCDYFSYTTALSAVTDWCKLYKKTPTMVGISSNSVDADSLVAWVVNNKDKFYTIAQKYKINKYIPVDYLYNECCKKALTKHEWKHEDSIYPFCMG